MGSPTQITNYALTGLGQLTSQYRKARGALVVLAPVLVAIGPNTGAQAGGDLVYLTGRLFDGVFGVTIGGALATIISAGGGVIIAKTPAGTGTQDVVVLGPGGSSTLAGGFTYAAAVAAPAISSLNWSLGRIQGGGLAIVATGTNLSGATNVVIGGNSVAPTSSTSTTCTFALPAHAAGVVTVAVTTAGGTSNTLSFEYWAPTQITGVDSYFDPELGVTTATGVSQWTDQIGTRTVTQGTGANQPVYTASAFGTLHGLTPNGSQTLAAASPRTFATGISVFAILKTTDTRTSGGVGYAGDAPNTIVGDSSASVNLGFGTDVAKVEFETFNAGWTSTQSTGITINDGVAHMMGFTFSTGNTITLYNGATSCGSGSQTYGNSGACEWNTIFGGFSTTDNANNTTCGPLIFVQGIVSGGDLAKLWAWGQQGWGAT